MDPYLNRYPRAGDVAVLCEGDLVGYEADLLEKWTASLNRFVDVWPCGTKTAIYGFSDAIGRSIPLVVIEDRDYRAADDAQKECRGKRDDRRGRQVRLAAWLTWNRHEIENYLLEPGISLPVLSEVFGASPDDVQARLEMVIAALSVDQAAQWTIHQIRALLPTEMAVGGLPRRTHRPAWNSQERRVEPVAMDVVAERLIELTAAVVTKTEKTAGELRPERMAELFRAKCDEWRQVSLDDAVWRVDWAGKEVLQMLCRWLAGEFGWKGQDEERMVVDWPTLIEERRDGEKDREMAYALQPRLEESLRSHLDSANDEIASEWTELRDTIVTAADFASSE